MAYERYGRFQFLDLREFFPPSISAFFIAGKTESLSICDISGFLKDMGSPADIVHKPRQIHSNIIIENCRDCECDGVFTKNRREAITIAVADCVPILISADHGKVLIALHSGWKGTLGKIAERTGSLFDPQCFDRVWIGPSIRKCCYKVGGERIKAFRKTFPESPAIDEKEKSLGLPAINAEMFLEMGVPREKMFIDGRCTCCSDEPFASYRRDGEKAGRMVLAAVRK